MGTKVQSNMQLPGYYSLRNLNGNTGNVVWPLHHESRTSGQYSDLFLTRLATGYGNKEDMRQTILKHDLIFRHQLHELHRLYRIQRDMMNQIKCKEGHKHSTSKETSHSNPFSAGLMSENERKVWLGSESNLLDLNCFRQSKPPAHNIQSQFSPLKGNIVQSGGCLRENGLKLENRENMESDCNNVKPRLFDLECPAEEGNVNNKDVGRGVSAVSGLKSLHFKRSYEVPTGRDRNLSMPNNNNYSCKGEATTFNISLRRTCGFTDLNEPILVEEASSSACVGNLVNINCSGEEVQRKDLSSVSHSSIGFHDWAAESCQESIKTRDKGLHLESERKQNGWFSNRSENGQTRSNRSFLPENSCAPCNSVHVETTGAQSAMFSLSDHNKRETYKKPKIFGVEITEKSDGESAVVAANSDILSCSSHQTKFPGNLSQNPLGNPGSTTYGQLNTNSADLMQGHDIIDGKLLVDSKSRFLPSLRAEVTPKNDLNFCCSFESRESRGLCPQVGLYNQNGISERKNSSEQCAELVFKTSFKPLPWMLEKKSAADMNMSAKAVDTYQIDEKSQSNFVSGNGSINKSSDGGLPFLRVTIPCNAKPVKEVEGSCQMNLPFLQNCSQQFVDKTAVSIQDCLSATCVDDRKQRKTNASDSSTSKKLLGFSIFENVCKDMPSPNSPLKLGSPASAIDGVNFVMNHGPIPSKCEEKCPVEGLVADNKLVNKNGDVRHIDLNLCVIEEGIEEDVLSTSSSNKTNVRISKIDLEKPVTIETGTNVASDCESLQSNLSRPSNLLHAEISEPQGPLSVSAAAEALVAISSSCDITLLQSGGSPELEKPVSDSLNWFADIVTFYQSDTENDVGSANGARLHDSIPDGIDYFELMTLKLTEIKVEECSFTPQVQENEKSEDTPSRRPRRGQARRGRQRKDFQRDVLPSLTSLSRNEMTEDLRMIEGLIKAVGGNWQSSLTQNNNAKGSAGKRRKRSRGPASPMTEDCLNQIQQMKTGSEERSLTGWGKRTRRLPRQRCLLSSLPLATK